MKKPKHHRFASLTVTLMASGLFFGATNPTKLPLVALIVGFILLTAIIYQLLGILVTISGWYGLNLTKKRQRLAKLTAAPIILILALQSIGELSPKDILVMLPLLAIVYMYFSLNKSTLKTAS